jgi:hypothetical protein
LEKEISKEDYDRLKIIKEKWDKDEIELKDISIEDAKLLSIIYDLEIKKVKSEIIQLEDKISEYETRMKEAIEYLNNKNKE